MILILWELFNIFSWNVVQMFLVLLWQSLHWKQFFMSRPPLRRGPFSSSFGPIVTYVPLFLENRLVFSHEIFYRCFWFYSNGHYTNFFHIIFGSAFWRILKPILVCDFLFLDNRSISFYEILYKFLKTLWPLFMDAVQLSQGYRAATRRQFTFLPLGPQKVLVLVLPCRS